LQVDGVLWDLERPLEKSCKLELLDFEHPEGKKVFWHSSAHVLGEAAERHYGCHLCLGPPTDDGFFYEMAIEERYVLIFRGLFLVFIIYLAIQASHERRLSSSRKGVRECDQGKAKVRETCGI